ncbi:MAG: MerR family DNA-binding transcriptional regulator [Clostridiaceae bacterium]
MKKYISIGEMSKLNNISVQALRHYDKIGLLKPSYIGENSNYRYYAIDRIPYVEVIKNLKYIRLSLEEIRNIVIESESLDKKICSCFGGVILLSIATYKLSHYLAPFILSVLIVTIKTYKRLCINTYYNFF